MKHQIIVNDPDYQNAVNYSQSLYSYPVTINIEDKKFIIGAGNSDTITVKFPYILTVNNRIGYAGLEKIDMDTDLLYSIVFLQNNDDFIDVPDFFDMSTDEQIKHLLNWEC